MSQNIFDNEIFFKEYIKIREGKNYNDLLEQPAMKKLLPELKDKKVLDIGCGYGKNAFEFAKEGAREVIGIDISQKMLEKAKKENNHENIKYMKLSVEELSVIKSKFDLVYSSLVFHYVENFNKLIEDINKVLNRDGILLFSQEHPFVTATLECKGHFELNREKEPVAYTFSDYSKSGKRVGTWFIEGVENYHRPFGEIINTLIHNGFYIEEVVEPLPSLEAIIEKEDLKKEFIRPTFLIIKARKK